MKILFTVLCCIFSLCNCTKETLLTSSHKTDYAREPALSLETELTTNEIGILPPEEIPDLGNFENSTLLPKQEIIPELSYFVYRVKEGDIIGYIAEDFGVTEDTITSINRIKSARNLQIGEYLQIPTISGITYTVKKDGETLQDIASKHEISAYKCSIVNKKEASEKLLSGQVLFLPDAKLDWVTRQEINGDLFKRPLKGYYVFTSAFGWRKSPFTNKRSYHTGVDMACPRGTSVYAAMEGKVVRAGWDNTYGNVVVIAHHSGYQTLYAHLHEILIKKGQWVTTTTRIGRVGSTGLSTGDHLHFTVMKNGNLVNPVNLWR